MYYGFSQYDKKLHDKIDCLIETLPVSKLADLSNGSIKHRLREFNGHGMFGEYMEAHSTTEYIQDTELLSAVIDIIQKG